jgi:hypothetical protein
MDLPVLIEPRPDRSGFTARLVGPFEISAEGGTADEAHRQVAMMLERRLQQGAELRSVSVTASKCAVPPSGWLPNDEITQDWLGHIQRYREEIDRAESQVVDDPNEGKSP